VKKITHKIYTSTKGNKLSWTSLETFGRWMDNRIETRRKHMLEVLSPHKYWVTQKKGTERAFTGDYWWYNDVGMYNCSICSQRLFTYEHKYKNKSGYPTFWNCLKDAVRFENDHLEIPEVTNAL
jgi:peptide methionine sulfoxide reductase MsrB